MLTNEQIKELKEEKYEIDNKIYELRELKSKAKDANNINECIELNQKIDKLRDKKRDIDDKLRHDHNDKVGSSFAIPDSTVKVKRRM